MIALTMRPACCGPRRTEKPAMSRPITRVKPDRAVEPSIDSAADSQVGPWLDLVSAARRLGYPCPNGRPPNSFYAIAEEIGHKLNGRWLIHVDDLDAHVRSH